MTKQDLEPDLEVGRVTAPGVPGLTKCNMDHVEFCRIGRAVYGKRWKAPLARRLDLSAHWVGQMARGKAPIAETTALAMLALERLPNRR